MDIANKTVKVKTWKKLISEYGMGRDRYIKVNRKYYSPFQEVDLPEDRIIKLDKNCIWENWLFTPEMIEQIITEPMTKEDLEKRLDEFKAELVKEHFPEVKRYIVCSFKTCSLNGNGKCISTNSTPCKEVPEQFKEGTMPEVKEDLKKIELCLELKGDFGKLVKCGKTAGSFSKVELLCLTSESGGKYDEILCTSSNEGKYVFLGNWNSGFDEQGRDWNK